MGKQVQFFMAHEDEKNFLASISRLAPVRLVCQTFADPSHMELEFILPVPLWSASLVRMPRKLRVRYPGAQFLIEKVSAYG